ncbi:aminopeptidase N [Chelativorans sp. AA-79]|uniref:aminopeptidase N n=1 Tax=Chelativorans sp. AA-79 TaxID=3028735 RepID=UPI0023F9DA99|nr:aminopeptidase N [Chelativorans sp. AA-79]WEX07714.1 aminopeptidase N [Chelativorans sp. AA-79]
MRTDTGQVFRLEDYRPSDYAIVETDLTFRLDPERTRVTATLTVERREGAAKDAPLVLDGDGLALDELLVGGKPAVKGSHEATPDSLTIRRLPKADRFEITIVTIIAPAANKALMGLYLSNGVYCTQCEAEGFRRITYYLDRPDVLSTYRVRIEAKEKEAPLLLSNGNPVENGRLGDGWHYAVWHDPFPKPSYLFALVAGDLGGIHDAFVTASGRKVKLGIYVEHGKEPLAAYAMDALKRSMRWDEERFGREYDLDVFNIVAVSDFNMGAMENKGLNVFNDKYVLADPETATDMDYANIEAIIAHEYFHNWTGNRITCRDWFQLCLKEGLTVYRDHEFSADQRSRAVKRIAEVRTLKAHQFPEDQGPLAHPVRPRRYREINNFYTATVYEKGSEVVRMIHTLLGAKDFRAGMDLYFERHDGQAVTIEDFLACFEEASGKDLSQFALWYHQAGTPNVTVSTSYDARAKEYTLEIEQSVPPTPSESRKRLMHIPLAFGLVGPNGQDMEYDSAEGAAVENGVIHLRKRRHTVLFKGVSARPVISLNRGFSAPITLALEMRPKDRLFLARHDSDLFSRWQALNTLFTEALIEASTRIRGGKTPNFEAALLGYPAEIAADENLEAAYRALALTLPAEADIAREIGNNIDPDAIGAAREALREAIAGEAQAVFAKVYDALQDDGPFSPDAASAGRRALRNVLLEYLSAAAQDPALAARQFEEAKSMTERAAALNVLAHQFPGSGAAEKALAAFEQRYHDNPLVLDKWFIVQATIPGDRTVDLVRRLMAHPAFSITNPNRVRSLVGGFASSNQTGFHRADGEGYRLLAETILRVEAHNPQVAARLAIAFRSWRSLEKNRQEQARAALSEIARQPELSRDLRDIVERTLA